MTTKIEYPLLPDWYWYSRFPNPKLYRVKGTRPVRSGPAYKGAVIGYLQDGDIVQLDTMEQALDWIRIMQVQGIGAPSFVYPEWRTALEGIHTDEVEREAWVELDLCWITPYDPEPVPEPEPVEPPAPVVPPEKIDVIWKFELFGYVFTIGKIVK